MACVGVGVSLVPRLIDLRSTGDWSRFVFREVTTRDYLLERRHRASAVVVSPSPVSARMQVRGHSAP
jgi:hypothetical protein